jgi:hypothetical protein
LQPLGDTKGKRTTADEINKRVDHVNRPDLIIPDLLHLQVQNLALGLFNEENGTCLVEALLGNDGENSAKKCRKKTYKDDPRAGPDGEIIFPPVKTARGQLR